MAMLRQWRSHGEVSLSLCQTLLRLVQGGDEAYKDKLQQQGLGVLATTVADMHQDRPQVVRLALRLLGVCSPQLLLDMMRESLEVQGASQTVRIGLEVLNWLTQLSAESVDEIARLGGREIISAAQPAFASDKMVTLQCLNLRRRLTKSKVRSLFKPTPKEVDASAEEVLRLRGCFEALDQDGGGFIDADELGLAFKMMGMKMSKPDLEKSLKEVDIDGSGQLEWPEFLSLMSKYGKGQSIEGSFTAERLAELKEIFSVFDADGSGSLEVKELEVVFRSLGLRSTEKEIRAMVQEVDADDSGTIDWHEFLFLMSKKIVNPRDQSLLSWEFFTGSKDTEKPLEKDVFVEKMQLLSQDFAAEQLNDMIFQAKFENSDLESITFLEFQRLIMRR
jgi:calmodulin